MNRSGGLGRRAGEGWWEGVRGQSEHDSSQREGKGCGEGREVVAMV